MRHLHSILLTSSIMMVSTNTYAADEKSESPWKSSAELGYVSVSGNTNTETIKGVLDASYESEGWLHKGHAETLSSKSETTDTNVTPAVTTEERSAAKWLVTGQSDYKITERDYVYGFLSYEDDRFSGFQYQAKLSVGYGRQVIKTEKHELKVEIGPGYRLFRVDQLAPPAPRVKTEDDTNLRLFGGYTWAISETSKFTQDLTAEDGKDQKEWKSVTALTANISGTLAMKLSHTVKYLDVVPPGNQNYDRETGVVLVFSF